MHDNQKQAQDINLAYISGIIDGEGTFMISKSTHGYKRVTPSYCARIRVRMSEPDSLKFIYDKTKLGIFKYLGVRKDRPAHHKHQYSWEIHSNDCLIFIKMIEPFLVLKKPQLNLMKEFLLNFKKTVFPRGKVPSNELAIREDAYFKMRVLNGKQAAATTKSQSTGDGEAIV